MSDTVCIFVLKLLRSIVLLDRFALDDHRGIASFGAATRRGNRPGDIAARQHRGCPDDHKNNRFHDGFTQGYKKYSI